MGSFFLFSSLVEQNLIILTLVLEQLTMSQTFQMPRWVYTSDAADMLYVLTHSAHMRQLLVIKLGVLLKIADFLNTSIP